MVTVKYPGKQKKGEISYISVTNLQNSLPEQEANDGQQQ